MPNFYDPSDDDECGCRGYGRSCPAHTIEEPIEADNMVGARCLCGGAFKKVVGDGHVAAYRCERCSLPVTARLRPMKSTEGSARIDALLRARGIKL